MNKTKPKSRAKPPVTGATRSRSNPLSPMVERQLAVIQSDLSAVSAAIQTGTLFWYLIESALFTVNLALRKIEAERITREMTGTTEGAA